MSSYPITKYECRLCVMVRCPNCDWTSPKGRLIPSFQPCLDCGAEWWTLISRPTRHRRDHDHLQPRWTLTRPGANLDENGKPRGRGRPPKNI